MSTLYRADDSLLVRNPAPAGVTAEQADGESLYLTDEVFLYRVVGIAASGMGEMVELEDCYSLNVVSVPIGDVRARRLRVVSAATGTG